MLNFFKTLHLLHKIIQQLLIATYCISATNELAIVERPSANTAYIRYNPSVAEQIKDSVHGISGLFKVQYDVQRSLDAGDIYVSYL